MNIQPCRAAGAGDSVSADDPVSSEVGATLSLKSVTLRGSAVNMQVKYLQVQRMGDALLNASADVAALAAHLA